MASYPSSIVSYSPVTDGVDYVQATHVNQANNEVVAIETELGTDVAGSQTNLKTRLAKSLSDAGYLDFATSTELTISGGSITASQNWHTVDTESNAASDDLDTIVASGVSDGFVLYLRADNTARTVVIKHNTGNIVSANGADITLDETYKLVFCVYDATLTKWIAAYPASSPGVSDGDKGDITVSASGATWTIDNNAVTTAKINSAAVTYGKLDNTATESDNVAKRTAKAWINFNGTGTPAIRDDFNISSITDNANGDWTLNFSTAMTDANYSVVFTAEENTVATGVWLVLRNGDTYTTAAVQIRVLAASTASYVDVAKVNVVIFGS